MPDDTGPVVLRPTAAIEGARAERERLLGIIDRADGALAEVGPIALLDARAYLARHDRPAMARAVEDASAAIASAREILAGADPADPETGETMGVDDV